MSNFMGFVYGLFVGRGKERNRPLSEREIIEQQRLLKQLDDRAAEQALTTVSQAAETPQHRTEQVLEPESQG